VVTSFLEKWNSVQFACFAKLSLTELNPASPLRRIRSHSYRPEVLDNVQNVTGVPPSQATSATESNGQVGNLQLSAQQEDDLVNFLKTLSDGYTKPNPVSP